MQANWKDFSKRLEIIMSARGLANPNELAKALGYNSPEKVYRLFRSEGALPSIELVVDVLSLFPDVNANWFVLGKGQPFTNKEEISNNVESSRPPYETLELTKKVAVFEQDIKLRDLQYTQLMERFNDVLVKMSELMQKQDAMDAELRKAAMH